MKHKITRRDFLKRGADISALSLLGGSLISSAGCGDAQKPAPLEAEKIAVVEGDDCAAAAKRAVDLLGGIESYVPKGAKVCLLPNAQKNHPGTFTKPEIVESVIEMCRHAGAKKISCLSWLPRKSWEALGLDEIIESAGAELVIVDMKDESLFKPVPIPRGTVLKEARIMNVFFDYDVFINLPITKDHAGNRFTGTMKNLMGLNSPKSNRTFHTGNFKNDNIEHLDQCIADLNTVLAPDLCIVDATEFIITNGPFGPGKLHAPRKVVAGTDRVAIDAYCCKLWDLEPREIIMIDRAHQLGLGEIDLTKKKIEESVI